MSLRWSISTAAVEFGIDRRTLTTRLAQQSIVAGKDGKYSTRQISDAIFGAFEKAKTRKMEADADIAEVNRARVRNEVIEVETVFHVWENIATGIKRTILTSPLPNEQKDCILRELQAACIEDYVEQREFDQGTPAEAG